MKKILKSGKKAVAALVLAMMAACMISSVAQGAHNINGFGSRERNSNGYCSYTKVSGYDDRGHGLNLKVGAKLGNGSWYYNSGSGTVAVRSASSPTIGNAWHSYRIGSGDKVTWIQN